MIDFVAQNASLAGAATSDNELEKKTESTTTPVIHTDLTDKILNLNINISKEKEKEANNVRSNLNGVAAAKCCYWYSTTINSTNSN